MLRWSLRSILATAAAYIGLYIVCNILREPTDIHHLLIPSICGGVGGVIGLALKKR